MSNLNSPSNLPQGQLQKLLLDLGPMLAFLFTNMKWGLLTATAVLMAATVISVAIGYSINGKINKFTLVGAVFVLVFGGITLYLQDTFYFKLKVTLVELLFATILVSGLWFKRLFIKDMLGEAVQMPDEAWRILTFRWAMFFVAMAILNIFIWQMFSDNVWGWFKAVGLIACTTLFTLANVPFIAKYIKE